MPRRFEVVAEDCVGCGLCEDRAPENIELPAGTSTAQVVKQPAAAAEEAAYLEASDYCPMGGLHVGAAVSPPADSSAGGAQPTLIPAGDPTPVAVTPTRLEN